MALHTNDPLYSEEVAQSTAPVLYKEQCDILMHETIIDTT